MAILYKTQTVHQNIIFQEKKKKTPKTVERTTISQTSKFIQWTHSAIIECLIDKKNVLISCQRKTNQWKTHDY